MTFCVYDKIIVYIERAACHLDVVCGEPAHINHGMYITLRVPHLHDAVVIAMAAKRQRAALDPVSVHRARCYKISHNTAIHGQGQSILSVISCVRVSQSIDVPPPHFLCSVNIFGVHDKQFLGISLVIHVKHNISIGGGLYQL